MPAKRSWRPSWPARPCETHWLKLEIHPDPKYLMPDPVETLLATELLVKRGFIVLPYVHADPVLCKRLEEAGAAAVMPLGSPIGSNLGLESRAFLEIIIAQSRVPVVVDAGLGAPSHAAAALEMGADAVLVNTAIAAAADPVAMAEAFRLGVEAGRLAREAGLARSEAAPGAAAGAAPPRPSPPFFRRAPHELCRRLAAPVDSGSVRRRIGAKTAADVRRALGRPRGSVDLEDFAALLSPAAGPFLEEMAQAAHACTVERFGRTMRLYAPLYLSNACANVCTYCGFSAHNRIRRKVLSDAEILAEAARPALPRLRERPPGHRRDGSGRPRLPGPARSASCGPHFSGLWIEVQPLPQEDYAALAEEGLSRRPGLPGDLRPRRPTRSTT